MKIMW